MGSSASSTNKKMTEIENGTKLEELSEGCISEILSRTTPIDTCRSATISKLFYSAAESDSVWERFLPPDYQDIIPNSTNSSKKELYFNLCNSPILVDHGTKSFRLERASGKKCYMIGARQLSIAWQDEPRYWVWTSHPNSRFHDVACLRSVFWFDIVGHLETRILSPNTTYAAYLVFKFGENVYGFDDMFKAYVTPGTQREDEEATDQTRFRPVCFRARGRGFPRPRPRNMQHPREREDGWMEMELGDFFVPREDDETKLVRMQVKEVEDLGPKSGIIVQGIEVRPK